MNRGDQIIELRNKGYSYRDIMLELRCSSGLVSYYCDDDGKSKAIQRSKNYNKNNPIIKKVKTFNVEYKVKPQQILKGRSIYRMIIGKINKFNQGDKMKGKITLKEAMLKLGDNPTCYITGEKIDINQTSTYNFDHIIPRSKGGTNTIDNLGICTTQANQCKNTLTYEELIDFCNKVINHHNQK